VQAQPLTTISLAASNISNLPGGVSLTATAFPCAGSVDTTEPAQDDIRGVRHQSARTAQMRFGRVELGPLIPIWNRNLSDYFTSSGASLALEFFFWPDSPAR